MIRWKTSRIALVFVSLLFTKIAAASDAPSFHVSVCDDTRLGEEARANMGQEVETIFSDLRVELSWEGRCQSEPRSEFRPNEASVQIRRSLPGKRRRVRGGGKIMGLVLPDPHGRPGPVIFLSVNAVREILKGTLPHRPNGFLVGRALGRVLSHELAHRFLSTTEHSEEGILRPMLMGTELIQDHPKHLYFTNRQREGLAHLGAERPNEETRPSAPASNE